MADLLKRADLLKEHVIRQKKEALAKVDSFIDDFLTGNKFDHLVKGGGQLDFPKILPIKFLSESPLDGRNLARDLFDLRDEIKVHIPAMNKCPGLLLYKISEYAGLYSIPLMESLSS